MTKLIIASVFLLIFSVIFFYKPCTKSHKEIIKVPERKEMNVAVYLATKVPIVETKEAHDEEVTICDERGKSIYERIFKK